MPTTSGRLLALLSLLQTRRDWSGAVLAERLDVSLRTVRRDVDRLRELGYPIAAAKGPDGGYRLGAGTELPPLLFDDEQAVALTAALQVAAASDDAAERALNTIRQVMPARLRRRIDALEITAVTPATVPVDGDLLLAISAAVRARETLRFSYAAAEGPPRRAEPHHVINRNARWYLVAWDLDRRDWRTFRVDRIALRTPDGPRFTPREIPGGDVAAFVTSAFRGATDNSGRWPCWGTVVLDLPATAAAPHVGDGLVEELGPGRCRLTLGSWSWTGLAAAVARFDADVSAADPPELAQAFALLARRFAAVATPRD